MTPKSPRVDDELLRRATELDALEAILPFNRRDQLAGLLTDDDVATLKHLAQEGMGENTLRALASDLGYLEEWARLATGSPLPWPAPETMLLKFVAHHLWDPVKRATDPAHGMPAVVEQGLRNTGLLKALGPHAPDTVRRRLTSWSILTRWRGLTGNFASPALKTALRLAVRASNRPRRRKSTKAVTGDVLAQLLATCRGEGLVAMRDRALMLLAFASGGRRRSEVAGLLVEDLIEDDPVPQDPADPTSPPLPCLTIRLGRTKNATADDDETVLLIGRPVIALREWLNAAGIVAGPVFRPIDQWGNVGARALTGQSVNLILKARCKQAGLDPASFSAHGLRSGFLTEAANRGIPLLEAMEQSRHKSINQAAGYYNNSARRSGRAARLISR